MATVPPTRLTPSLLLPRMSTPTSALLTRISRYTILVALVHPLLGIGLAIATLRERPDAVAARRARIAIAVGAVAYVLYAVAIVLLVRVCLDLVVQLMTLLA